MDGMGASRKKQSVLNVLISSSHWVHPELHSLMSSACIHVRGINESNSGRAEEDMQRATKLPA